MTNKLTGWLLGAASMFSMLGLMALDIKALHSWSEALTPQFIGSLFAHVSTVGMAFLGGKLIPTEPQNQREDDNTSRKK